MYMARYLGSYYFGVISFALAFTGIFGIIVDMGLNTLTVREVSKNKQLSEKYLNNFLSIKIILAILTFITIIVSINLLGYNEKIIFVVYLFALYVIISNIYSMFYSIFQSHEKMEYQSLGQIINSSLMLIGVILGIYYGFNIFEFAYLYLIISCIILLYVIIICIKKFFKPKFNFELEFWIRSLKESWPLGIMALFIIIYFKIDSIMLSYIVGENAVGLYNAAYRLVEVSTIMPTIFITAIFPIMATLFKENKINFHQLYIKSSKYMFYISLPMAFSVTLLANPIISLIFGIQYEGSVIALQILIWASAVMYVTIIQGTTIISANKQLFSLKVTLIAAIINIILNIILIPQYSYIGASIATVITEVFGLIVGIHFLNKWGYYINWKNTYLIPLISIIISLMIAMILISIKINIILVLITSLSIYALIIYFIGLKEEDINFFKEILQSIR